MQYNRNNTTFIIIFVQYNRNNITFMKTRTISVCINTITKEIIAFQSISQLSNHVNVHRMTIVRKSKLGNTIKDIEGFMIFLNVDYITITKK